MRPETIKNALQNHKTILVAQVAPAVRVSLGEPFGYEPGTSVEKKIPTLLRKLGFKYVFDSCFGADVAIVEESRELEERVKNNDMLPIINSCCPGTVSFLEHSYPELVGNIASVKSPMEVTGVLIKTYFAEKMKIKPEKIFSVAVMPCVIKKAEALKPELRLDGKLMVDAVLTTKELVELMKEKKIKLGKIGDSDFDSLMGTASGSGKLFGSSGGVSEAALREYAFLKGVPMEKIDQKMTRGSGEIRELVFKIDGKEFKIAIVNSLRNASRILNDNEKLKEYCFVEIMACLGGCVGGSGQPPFTKEILEKRRKGLFKIDSESKFKVPSQNPAVKELYDNFLGNPLGKKAKKLLHTKFERVCVDCF